MRIPLQEKLYSMHRQMFLNATTFCPAKRYAIGTMIRPLTFPDGRWLNCLFFGPLAFLSGIRPFLV
jgi:hypothetical protein